MESCGTSMSRSHGGMVETGHFSEIGTLDRVPKNKGQTVAIIEDEKGIVEVYGHICRMMGLTISFVAYDGAEGLEAFRKSTCPDVILIDHRMPGMMGIEAMGRMLDINPDASFIMLSADEEIKNDALDAGAKAFLKKPATIAEPTILRKSRQQLVAENQN